MGTTTKWLMPLMAVAFLVSGAIPTQSAQAAAFTTLHSFCSNANCPDGSGPNGLIQATDGNFYGTTFLGANFSYGTIFKLTRGGTLTTLYSFCSATPCSDGQLPTGLIQATNGKLYGTTNNGGAHGNNGTVFEITLSGMLTQLQSLPPGRRSPDRPLIQGSDGNFYGNSSVGGSTFSGLLYKITPSDKYSVLYTFCLQSGCLDGMFPNGLLQASDGNFYGTTAGGGASNDSTCSGNNCGTVFKYTPGGTLTTLYSFCLQRGCPDGNFPLEQLIQGADGNFYGTTDQGGTGSCFNGCGTLFRITSDGTLTTLYSFCSQSSCSDGASPSAVIQGSDGNLYGTTSSGGANSNCSTGCGTIFKITLGGTLTTLHNFCAQLSCTDGRYPGVLLQNTDGSFYGTTDGGAVASTNGGTIFKLSVGLAPFVEPQTTSGEVGTAVKILGTELKGSTRVTFNGTAAAFTVSRASEISTTVPAGATTGYVVVTTPEGLLTSNEKFTVIP